MNEILDYIGVNSVILKRSNDDTCHLCAKTIDFRFKRLRFVVMDTEIFICQSCIMKTHRLMNNYQLQGARQRELFKDKRSIKYS